jgi:hypothetical protein
MRALIVTLVLMLAVPAHADRRQTGKILVGVGLAGVLVVTTALAIVGSWGNSGDCAKQHSADACHDMMLAGYAGGGIAGPLSGALIVTGGVIYDRSSETASVLRIRF